MKKGHLLVAILATSFSFGQNIFPASGNVGIGTINPASNLEINTINTGSQFNLLNSGLTLSNISLGVGKAIGSGNSGFFGWQNTGQNTGYLFLESFSSSMPVVLNQLGGNVGIGTTNPTAVLDVFTKLPTPATYNTQHWTTNNPEYNLKLQTVWNTNGINQQFVQRYNGIDYTSLSFFTGNVGIGTAAPETKLHIVGDALKISINQNANDAGYYATLQAFHAPDTGLLSFVGAGGSGKVIGGSNYGTDTSIYSNTTEKIRILSNGYVGIGTTTPDTKLTVNGNIHAKEVKIDLSVPAPDYVFANDYKLKTLKEVETYINKNKHLPEIPSAKEFEKNGVLLAEMNMSLLKKVEELTLYVLELKKENEIQNQKIEAILKKK